MSQCSLMFTCVPAELHQQVFGLPCVEVVLLAPVHKVLNKFPVVPDEADDSRVVRELDL